MGDPPRLRDKVSALRRQHLVSAAIKVFAERGFHRATIRDVAREAGIADGSVYAVFASKAEILRSLLDPLDEAAAPPPDAAPADPADFLRDLLRRRWATFTPETLDALRVIFSEVLVNEELRALYVGRIIGPAVTLPEPVLRGMMEAGRLRPLDISLTLRLLTAAVLGVIALRLVGDEEVTARWDEMPDRLAALVLDGIRPAPEDGDDRR